VTFWEVLRRIVTNWRLMGLVCAVVVLALVAEALGGDNARFVTLWLGVAVGAVLIRRWL